MNTTRPVTTLALLLLPILFCATTAVAQERLRPRIGIGGGYALSEHEASFSGLPGIPSCCPEYTGGSGKDPLGGLFFEYPLSSSFLLTLGADYAGHSVMMSEREPLTIIVRGQVVQGAFAHTLDATLASIGLEPGVSWNPVAGLLLHGGVRLGTLITKEYAQREQIVEPEGTGTFIDSLGNDTQSRTRNESSGEIPQTALLAHAIGGIAYDLPLDGDGTLTLRPGVSYALGLTDMVDGLSWKANSVRFTLGVTYALGSAKRVVRDTIFERDTALVTVARGAAPAPVRLDRSSKRIDRTEEESEYLIEHVIVTELYVREVAEVGTITARLAAAGVDKGIEEVPATLRIEEFLRTSAHPLLGYVFFEEGSAEIPERYIAFAPAGAALFEPQDLFGEDAMGIAHNILNIVGHTMTRTPSATLTITGTNADAGVEKGNRGLSRSRAEAVKSYLAGVWGIAPERLIVAERDLPALPSNTKTTEGLQENRRVELTSNDPSVIDIFIAQDTTRTASPPMIRFRPEVASTGTVASWTIRARQGEMLLKEITGSGAPPAVIDWALEEEQKSIPRFTAPLHVTLEAVDDAGYRTTSEETLETDVLTIRRKAEERLQDYRIDRYNLVLFDVGTSTITTAQKRTTDMIRAQLTPESIVTIEGFTDRTGDAEENRLLALDRARATAKALGRPDATIVGVGEDQLLYDNDLPEGRFYCRTVRITVKTPVE